MKKYILSFSLLFSITDLAQAALEDTDPYIDPATLEDPRTRNEDISHSIVTVNYVLRSDGYYEYEYAIQSPIENKGEVLIFEIDLSCEKPATAPLGFNQVQDLSNDGKHIVIEVDDANYNDILGPSIGAHNTVSWLTPIMPGGEKVGLRFISKEAPIERTYTLEPTWGTANWGYALYENDTTVPWVDDFIVTGTILAPRCSTDTSPIPDEPNTPPADGGDKGTGDDTTPTDCKKGKGKATGHDIGLGHEISNGKHLGHEHDCE